MATFNKVSYANASPKGGGDNRLNSIPAKAKHVNDLIDALEIKDQCNLSGMNTQGTIHVQQCKTAQNLTISAANFLTGLIVHTSVYR